MLSDHLSLAPDVVEALKHDLIEVISRYCDVDAANCDVTFEQQEKQVAMLANIPILGMHNRPKPPGSAAPPPAAPPPRTPEPPPSLEGAGATATIEAPTPATAVPDVPSPQPALIAPEPIAAAPVAAAPRAPASPDSAPLSSGTSRKRKRRRANAVANGSAATKLVPGATGVPAT